MAKTPGSTADTNGNKAEPPFSIGGKTTMAGSSGGRDFTNESRPQGSAESGGKSFNSNNSGGRDFTKESRPQSDAKQEVKPNPQEIPAGGAILKADPQPVSAKVSGTATAIANKTPFRGLK
jgi:hypothetical protein